MQVEADFEVVVAQVQDMALRRGLFVAYMPLIEAWTVNDPAAGGKMLLYDAEIERLIRVSGRLRSRQCAACRFQRRVDRNSQSAVQSGETEAYMSESVRMPIEAEHRAQP